MTRRDRILKNVSTDQRGIELGPWFSPLASKREGYQCLSLDIFETETLRSRARLDQHITAEQAAAIEDVDIVGSSVAIGDLIAARGESGTFDYIVSSHNFEHLPNPIRFLNGCFRTLKSSGVLSMAIPDHRNCFDYFRPVTRLSDWIHSFHVDQQKPTPAQVFDGRIAFAYYMDDTQKRFDFSSDTPASLVACDIELDQEWALWASLIQKTGACYQTLEHDYIDAHCSVFTPSSFELLVRDCGFLGLANFAVEEVVPEGFEFHAHLRPTTDSRRLKPSDYALTRTKLLHRIRNEEAENSSLYQHCNQMLQKVKSQLGDITY